MKSGFASGIKSVLVPAGIQPRRLPLGLYRGLTFEIDLRYQTQLYLGLWERETYRSIRTAMSRCAWAVDVGAGQGELCLRLLRSPATGPIFAFEPQDSSVAVMRRNAALNHCDDDGRLVILTKLAGPATTDTAIAIDDLPLDPQKPGFLKVDVDGAELTVLEGATKTLTRCVVDVLVETHSAQLEQHCAAFFSARGYACTVIANAWWRSILPEQRPIEHNRWLWATNATA